jgi:hypothetical protein
MHLLPTLEIRQLFAGFLALSPYYFPFIQTMFSIDAEYFHAYLPTGSRDSSVGIATRPALDPTQPPIQWVPGTVSPLVNRQGPEADHSLPSSVEVNNDGAIPQIPHISSQRSA